MVFPPGYWSWLLGGGFCSLFSRPLPISTEGRHSHEGGLITIALRIWFRKLVLDTEEE
jgi:hypothetical protein